MGYSFGVPIVTDGLVYAIDMADQNSYQKSSTTVSDLATNKADATIGNVGSIGVAYEENDRKGLINGLIATVFLGFIFSCFQEYEYHHAAFTISQNIYGSTFYMATGFHGFHVIIGTIFLAVCLYRSMKGHFKPDHHFGFEAAAWYWHFVDVVWLFLFAAIYIWGS